MMRRAVLVAVALACRAAAMKSSQHERPLSGTVECERDDDTLSDKLAVQGVHRDMYQSVGGMRSWLLSGLAAASVLAQQPAGGFSSAGGSTVDDLIAKGTDWSQCSLCDDYSPGTFQPLGTYTVEEDGHAEEMACGLVWLHARQHDKCITGSDLRFIGDRGLQGCCEGSWVGRRKFWVRMIIGGLFGCLFMSTCCFAALRCFTRTRRTDCAQAAEPSGLSRPQSSSQPPDAVQS